MRVPKKKKTPAKKAAAKKVARKVKAVKGVARKAATRKRAIKKAARMSRDKALSTIIDMERFIAAVRAATRSSVPYHFTRQDTGLEKRVKQLAAAATREAKERHTRV